MGGPGGTCPKCPLVNPALRIPTVNTDSSERYGYGYQCKCGCETDCLYVIFKNYARLYRI